MAKSIEQGEQESQDLDLSNIDSDTLRDHLRLQEEVTEEKRKAVEEIRLAMNTRKQELEQLQKSLEQWETLLRPQEARVEALKTELEKRKNQ